MRSWCEYRYVRRRWRVLFTLIDALGWSVRRLVETFAPTTACPACPSSILIVQLDHLGDAILSIGLLRGLKAAYPNARLDVLASESNAELFAGRSEVDRVFVSRVNRFSRVRRWGWGIATVRWGWRLRRERYDLAIDPRGDFPAAVILWLTGAAMRLGWDSGGGGFFLTHRAEFVRNRHEVLSRQALLDVLGIAPPPGQPAWAPLTTHSPLTTHHSPLTMVLHLGAGTAAKRWPARHWQELIGRLIVEHDPRIVLVGSAADRELVRSVLEDRPWPSITDRCGTLTIDELADVLRNAHLFIGADSGPAHLAAAVGTPVVAIFSGTNRAEQWKPWGERVRVVRHATVCSPCHRERCPLADHPCMSGVLPGDVMAAARELLPVPVENREPRRLERISA